ncbi:MAG: hypothetical protein NTX50_14110 [Candidatus Sumerlaeota bacterium]|nr:hypothetical protein [Candidatus Sumerlaeota bacterium]
MNDILLVAEKQYRKAEAVFRAAQGMHTEPAPAAEARLAEAIRSHGARAVIVGADKYCGLLYEALAASAGGRGALIARFGVGHDNIDKAQARQHGIIVTNTPGVLDVSVAEHTMWLIGALAKHVCMLDACFRKGEFVSRTGMEIRGKALAVVGFGSIGRRVAAMAHFGFGMKVLAIGARSAQQLEYQERRPLAELFAEYGAANYTNDLDSILPEADVLSLHLPSNPQTRRLINADRLARMKPGAMLINTARGAVVDEIALYDALASGQLAGAALDVFENEPYQPVAPDKDLRRLENVALTPHVGSNTLEANARMAQSCLDSARKFFDGRLGELPRVDIKIDSA